MPATSSRLQGFTESVIRGMTRLANEHGAINLSQGFPDFDPPEELLEALERAVRGPHHQYAITWGAPRFRAALSRKIRHFSGVEVDPEENLVVTCGSTEAMMVAMMTCPNCRSEQLGRTGKTSKSFSPRRPTFRRCRATKSESSSSAGFPDREDHLTMMISVDAPSSQRRRCGAA